MTPPSPLPPIHLLFSPSPSQSGVDLGRPHCGLVAWSATSLCVSVTWRSVRPWAATTSRQLQAGRWLEEGGANGRGAFTPWPFLAEGWVSCLPLSQRLAHMTPFIDTERRERRLRVSLLIFETYKCINHTSLPEVTRPTGWLLSPEPVGGEWIYQAAGCSIKRDTDWESGHISCGQET